MSITTRDQLLTLALRAARVVPAEQTPRAADLSLAAEFFNLELLSLQGRSDILQTVPRKTLTLADGTDEYTLPSDTIDVATGPNDEIGTIVPTDGAETPVYAMSRTEYLTMSSKDASGRPVRGYVEKLDTVRLVLWPVPDAYAVSFRYAQVRISTQSATGSATIDLQKRWFRAVMLATAAEVARAKSMPLDLVGSLRGDAEGLYRELRANDVGRGSIQMVVSHRR